MKAIVFTLFLFELFIIGALLWVGVNFFSYRKHNNGNIEVLKEGLKSHKNSINRLNKEVEDIHSSVDDVISKIERVYSDKKNDKTKDNRDFLKIMSELNKNKKN